MIKFFRFEKRAFFLLLFFASGCAALIYQVSWERALFAITGVDLESTTIIVSIFMLGIGCGALIGGYLADAFPKRRIYLFALIEAAVGCYGLVSLRIISYAGDLDLGPTAGATIFKAMLALMLPTLLMGTTLPILITYMNKSEKNIGVSTGSLYKSNTMGAAAGAGSASFFLFGLYGLSGTVLSATFINFAVAILALCCFRKEALS